MIPSANPPSRPLQALVDLAALHHNLAQTRRRAGARPLWAVVKANAYGHGIENAVRAFAPADGLALLEISEAWRARRAGWRKPILLLEGCFETRDLQAAAALDLTVVLHCAEQVAMLAAAPLAQPVKVYLKFDTGMHRLGFARPQAAAVRARLAAVPQARVIALMTHLANADRPAADAAGAMLAPAPVGAASLGAPSSAGPTVLGQYAALRALAPDWQGAWSVSNSAALFLHPAHGPEWVRPGICLYGAAPAAGLAPAALGLRAAMTLLARVLAVRDVAAGETVGYGSVWRAPQRSRIAVVSCGYADGYPRAAPEGTPVWLGGQRVALVGRVSMDMLTVDVTGVDAVTVGAPVELWGAHVAVDEVAERVGSVGYELLSRLPARVREADVGVLPQDPDAAAGATAACGSAAGCAPHCAAAGSEQRDGAAWT